jgi:pilus assembly protein FimV
MQLVDNLTSQFKLVFAVGVLALSALVATPSAFAVGLGEITVKSALNEPLAATIQIINSSDLQDNQLLVSLASAEAFERAGVSRDFFLSRLQFSIDRDRANQRIVKIITDQPVVEPYLDFLVQLQWPEGRVMRSYTMLLDLPIYREDQSATIEVSPPVTLKSPEASNPVAQSSLPEAGASDRVALTGDQHQVILGDTLWNVAQRLRPQGATVLQTMDSLYLQNANAFSDGDANRLMKGAVLRLPSLDEIREEAGDMVASQIGLVAPTEQDAAVSIDADVEIIYADEYSEGSDDELAFGAATDARLELVSASEDPAKSGSSQEGAARALGSEPGETVQQLSSELAVANDEVNKFQLENSELRQRLALLEAQVATMAELVEQAQKQADLDRAASVPAKADSDLSAALVAVPAYFWAALIALILLLLVVIMRQPSSSSRDNAALSDLPMASYENYDSDAPNKATAAATLHELDDLELDPDDDLFDESDNEIFDSIEETIGEDVFDMMVEAVAEAEVYLSLGNTPQAIQVLEDARAQDPADAASRLKLMEILFREGRKDELSAVYEEILLTEDDAAIEMAAIIAGPQGGAVTELEDSNLESSSELGSLEHADIEGLELGDVDSPEPADSPELVEADSAELVTESTDLEGTELESTELESTELEGTELNGTELESAELEGTELESADARHPELEDLGFSDMHLEALELDDLDIDSLDIQDFDIELDDLPQKSKKSTGATEDSVELQLPGGEDLDDILADFAAESAVDGDSETDGFSGLDDISSLDSAEIKLDLAKTYVEMGDPEGAKEILEELLGEAGDDGKTKAQALLDSLK